MLGGVGTQGQSSGDGLYRSDRLGGADVSVDNAGRGKSSDEGVGSEGEAGADRDSRDSDGWM
jgi:hypothetical protein